MKANGRESDIGGWLLLEACKAWVCFVLHLDFGSIYSDSFAHELWLLSWLYCGIQCWFPSPLHYQTFSSVFFISELGKHLLLTFTYFFNTIPHQTLTVFRMSPSNIFRTSSFSFVIPLNKYVKYINEYTYVCVNVCTSSPKTQFGKSFKGN